MTDNGWWCSAKGNWYHKSKSNVPHLPGVCAECGNNLFYRKDRKPKNGKRYCSQTCNGMALARLYAVPFIKGHTAHNFKGMYVNRQGYKMQYYGDQRKTMVEHRAVVEKARLQPLESWEIVHHKNGNKLDNQLSNLEVMGRKEHAHLHASKERKT